MSSKKLVIDKYKHQIYWFFMIVGVLGLIDMLVKSANGVGFMGYVIGYPLLLVGLSGDTLNAIVGWVITFFNLGIVWVILALYVRAKYILRPLKDINSNSSS